MSLYESNDYNLVNREREEEKKSTKEAIKNDYNDLVLNYRKFNEKCS